MLARRGGQPRAGGSGADASLRVLARRGRRRWRARRRHGRNDVPRMSSSRAHHKLRFHNSRCAQPQNGDHAIWVVIVMRVMQKRAATPLSTLLTSTFALPDFHKFGGGLLARFGIFAALLPTQAPDPGALLNISCLGSDSRPENFNSCLESRPKDLGSGGETRRTVIKN